MGRETQLDAHDVGSLSRCSPVVPKVVNPKKKADNQGPNGPDGTESGGNGNVQINSPIGLLTL
jgi:hypothetical protein